MAEPSVPLRRAFSGDRPQEADGVRAARGQTDRVLAPSEYAERISGFEVGYDGVLEPVFGPCPLVADYGAGYPAYSTVHGIFHATINRGGPRSILLAHVGTELWEFRGSTRSWRVLVGATGLLNEQWSNNRRPGRFPTQFVATPVGIVIIPQTGRALFYDGEVLAQFGYDRGPGMPSVEWVTSNRDQLKHNGIGPTEFPLFTTETFGLGTAFRTVDSDKLVVATGGTAETVGFLQNSIYGIAVRWVDRWGNVSPLSPTAMLVLKHEDCGAWAGGLFELDRVLKSAGLAGIERGPDHTIGRIVCKTKDLRGSGDSTMYDLPGEFPSAWATIPENISGSCSLAQSDLQTGLPTVDALPMPEFRLGQIAIGRFWAANVRDDPGRLSGSFIGRWGTLDPEAVRYPDPQGGEITALWPFQGGLLVCTQGSTFLVNEGADGSGLRVQPASRMYGCAAPSSFATLPDGTPIWYSGDGFLMMTERGPQAASGPIARRLSKCNAGRASQAAAYYDRMKGEYRCWLPSGGSDENDLCFTFDGRNWRERPGERLEGVVQLRDGSRLAIGGGRALWGNTWVDGVWVLDHQTPAYGGPTREYRFESVWFQRAPDATHQSPMRLVVWLREERASSISVALYRDYREGVDVLSSATVSSQSSSDPPPQWGATVLGDGSRWQRRRLFWTRLSIDAAGCESFKVVLSGTSPYAIMALEFDGIDRHARMRTEGQ